MDSAQLERAKSEHENSLHLCQDQIARWEKFRTDYETLQQRLETLPDKLSYDITVPFSPSAFTMGKLVHTNKILVLLGDNWFAEVSAKQAVEIAKRRIVSCDKMLEDLRKEKEQCTNWVKYIDEVSENNDLIEIVEKYDEENEKKWREQHTKNVKAHREKLLRERNNSLESIPSTSEDEADGLTSLMKFCNMVEQQEDVEESTDNDPSSHENEAAHDSEPSQELTDSNDSEVNQELPFDENGIVYVEDNQSIGKHQNKLKLLLSDIPDRKASLESETGDEDTGGRKDSVSSSPEDEISIKNDRHVKWQDLTRQRSSKITFKHSRSKNKPIPNAKRQNSSESEHSSSIQSPSDIYKHFNGFFQPSPPKSILKVKHSPPVDGQENFFPFPEPIENGNHVKKTVAFTGEVYEHTIPINNCYKKSSRPTSHFKNSRKNRKK